MSELHSKLVQNKLDEICYALASYFNYLIIPRKGFLIVGNDPNGVLIEPKIDLSHILYLLNEIYPCQNFNYNYISKIRLIETINPKTNKPKIKIPEEAKNTIRKLIRKYVDFNCLDRVEDPVFRDSLDFKQADSVKIDEDVVNKIYSFKVAYEASLPADNDVIRKSLVSLLHKKTVNNFGFNSDTENTAIQGMLYVISALVDSIAIKHVGKTEVESAFQIIVPKDLHDKYRLSPVDDERTRKLISDAFNSRNLTISNEALQLITDYMIKVEQIKERVFSHKIINPLDDDSRVLNRMIGFCNYI